jgi:hypothetical protein
MYTSEIFIMAWRIVRRGLRVFIMYVYGGADIGAARSGIVISAVLLLNNRGRRAKSSVYAPRGVYI